MSPVEADLLVHKEDSEGISLVFEVPKGGCAWPFPIRERQATLVTRVTEKKRPHYLTIASFGRDKAEEEKILKKEKYAGELRGDVVTNLAEVPTHFVSSNAGHGMKILPGQEIIIGPLMPEKGTTVGEKIDGNEVYYLRVRGIAPGK